VWRRRDNAQGAGSSGDKPVSHLWQRVRGEWLEDPSYQAGAVRGGVQALRTLRASAVVLGVSSVLAVGAVMGFVLGNWIH
jgi:hypothetical protein